MIRITGDPASPTDPREIRGANAITAAEALIEEARRRHRHRQLVIASVVLVAGVVLAVTVTVHRGGGDVRAPDLTRSSRSSSSATAPSHASKTVFIAPSQPTAVAVSPTGKLCVANDGDEILERLPNGRFTLATNTDRLDPLGFQIEGLGFGSDGGLFVSINDPSPGLSVLREVAPDGKISTVVGGGRCVVPRSGPLIPTEGIPGRDFAMDWVGQVAPVPGGVYFSAEVCPGVSTLGPIFELTPDGRVHPVALDSLPAVEQCAPSDLAFSGAGDVYLACGESKSILVVGSTAPPPRSSRSLLRGVF